MAKQKAPEPAKPPPKGTPPSNDVQAQFDRLREEAISLREVADKAAEAAEAKYDEVVEFATANGITEEAEGEELEGDA
jgi:hypothetical protein